MPVFNVCNAMEVVTIECVCSLRVTIRRLLNGMVPYLKNAGTKILNSKYTFPYCCSSTRNYKILFGNQPVN